jgi:hypothetical protein
MTNKTKNLMLDRLREILGGSCLETLKIMPQYDAIYEAVENGWPWGIRRTKHGYVVYISKKTEQCS